MRRSAEDLTPGEALKADVLVVGAGPLGIVNALELADAGHQVVLIESGGLKPDERAQDLAEPASQDQWHVAKPLAVRRQVGGTSTMWGGRCVPFDPIDFEARPAVPEELWPVPHAEIAEYFQRASDWMVTGRSAWTVDDVPEIGGRDLVPGLTDGEVRSTELERWSLPTRYGKLYGDRLRDHPRIDLVTGLTATHLTQSPDGRIEHVVLKTIDGREHHGVADRYVLATGGLEATRLLMVSRDLEPAGIGSASGHLGRWYMAHVEARVAELHFTTDPDETIFAHELDRDGVYVRRRFTFTPELQRRDELANAATWIVNSPLADDRHGSGILSGVYLTLISPIGGFLLTEAIRQAGTKAKRPTSVRAHLRNIVRDLGPAIAFAVSFTYRRFLRRGRKAPGFFIKSASNVYPLHYHGEHRPHRESHVALSEEVDGLGMQRLEINMHFSEDDVTDVRRAMEHIDAHVRARGVGHIEYLDDDVDGLVRDYLKGNAGYHQTGTTRMSASPEDGVVNADLQVHGVDNLFIASTSVFPTSSQANPTFTGVAFSVRLADHLRALAAAAPAAREPERLGSSD